MIHWENINPISQELWIYMCLWFLILFSHLGKECEWSLTRVTPCLQTQNLTISTPFIVTASWHFFGHKKKPQGIILHLESWFAAGSECKNRWKGPTLPRIANFCPSSQTLFLSRVKPYLSDLFAHFDTFFPRVYRLFLTFSLRIEWACVLVFVERFLV